MSRLGGVRTKLASNPASQITSKGRDNDAYAFTGYVSVSRSYATNGLNQYTTAGPATFSYDANGNLTGDGTSTYSYDVENRLVSASGGVSATLTYDPNGRLSSVASGSNTTWFLYDGDELAAEYTGAGTMTKRYMFAGQDEPIFEDTGGALNCSGTRFLHTDHQGSVIALADCSGNRTNVDSYDEYGIPASTNTGRFQYTGQAWLPELGMYYYKARIYSPTLGRFMQVDPIGYGDQNNLYAYVGNDPIDGRDPSGEQAAPPDDRIIVQGQCASCHTRPPPPPLLPWVQHGPTALPSFTLPSFRPFSPLRNLRRNACAVAGIFCSTSDEVDEAIDEVLDGGTVTDDNKDVKNVEKGTGQKGANEDFDKLAGVAGTGAKPINTSFGPGRVVQLPGGGTASVRPGSKGGQPTVQIHGRPGQPTDIKIRY